MATITLGDSASAIRTTLGLGTAATTTAGTSANNTIQLDSSGRIPAMSGVTLLGVSGKIKQIVTAESTSNASYTNNSYADGISLNITPTATSSKILVFFVDGQYNQNSGVATNNRIVRNGSDISGSYQNEQGSSVMMHSVNIMVEDSPNTTSSVEYKHQYYHQNGTGQLSLNGAKRQLVAIEVGS